MAKVYIKKVSVVNGTYFKKLGIDPAKLSLSQRSHTDKLMTLVKPASNSYFKEGVWNMIKDFVELTNGKDRTFISNAFRSVKIQIESELEGKGESRKGYKFDISQYSNCELIDRLVEIESKSRPIKEEASAPQSEEEEAVNKQREEILFNHGRFQTKEDHNEFIKGLDKDTISDELTYQDYCEAMAQTINEKHGIGHMAIALKGCDIWKMEKEGMDVNDDGNIKKILDLKRKRG